MKLQTQCAAGVSARPAHCNCDRHTYIVFFPYSLDTVTEFIVNHVERISFKAETTTAHMTKQSSALSLDAGC